MYKNYPLDKGFYCTLLIVNLTSSASKVCPGDTVVFTCVTNTAPLIWRVNGDTSKEIIYFSANQVNIPILDETEGIFTIELVSTMDGFKSTATAYNVSLNSNGSNITCTDNTLSKHDHSNTENSEMIIIG